MRSIERWGTLALCVVCLACVACDDDTAEADAGGGGSDTGMIDGAAGAGGEGGMGIDGGQGGEGGMGGMPLDMGEEPDPDIGDEDGGAPDPCESYCDLMIANCPSAYPARADCRAVCALLPADGRDGDDTGNTVQCRADHAADAAANPAEHCPAASANGGGVCGSYCEAYCSIVEDSCGDLYADEAACMAECAALPQDGAWDAVSGDSVQCRTYHGSFPALADAALHCPHAAAAGGDNCGTYCEVYCNRIEANCDGLYPDRDTCLDLCSQLPTDGAPGDTVGNSIQCRIYHATLPAAEDGALHCPHASLAGGDTCGSYCDVYCDMVDRNCGDAAQFPDRDACLDTCEAFPTNGDPVATIGNSVQCRIYHGSYPAEIDPEFHCPHAGVGGADVCGSWCEGYCSQMAAHCPQTYGSYDACITFCEVIPADGMWNDTDTNSLQCRTYHASFPAAGDPGESCPRAGLTGGDMCGSYCDVYCDFVDSYCSEDPMLYANRDACQEACGDFSRRGRDGDTVGDSVHCRIYHASFPAQADSVFHCPHAAPDGGGVCEGPALCEQYCDAMLENCAGAYPDEHSCLMACALFPANAPPEAQEGNSAQCRLYHAGVAADDPALHCPHASAHGGGVCGSYCENYCSLVNETCDGLFPDVATCLAECEQLPSDGASDALDEDSVQCRVNQIIGGLHGNAAAACANAHPAGGGACGETCEVYCNRMEANCPDSYPDRATCEAACAIFPADGMQGAVNGDTVQCRINHAGVPAADDARVSCPRAGNTGGGTCGSYCDVYCRNVLEHCTDELSVYGGDRAACMATCEAFPTNGADGAEDGNSVQCRIYHASFPSEDSPPVHCPHAGITGGGVCGDACDAYCDQLEAHCVGPNAQYPNRGACRAGCIELPRDGLFTDVTGNSVQCRAYHASFPSDADPALHCPHAGFSGAGVCVD